MTPTWILIVSILTSLPYFSLGSSSAPPGNQYEENPSYVAYAGGNRNYTEARAFCESKNSILASYSGSLRDLYEAAAKSLHPVPDEVFFGRQSGSRCTLFFPKEKYSWKSQDSYCSKTTPAIICTPKPKHIRGMIVLPVMDTGYANATSACSAAGSHFTVFTPSERAELGVMLDTLPFKHLYVANRPVNDVDPAVCGTLHPATTAQVTFITRCDMVWYNSYGYLCAPKPEYYRGQGTKTWAKAKEDCESRGDQLASIKSLGENEAAIAACTNQNELGCWIGLTDPGTGTKDKTKWVWTDGSANTLTTTWWNVEPNNGAPKEGCVHLWMKRNGGWNDLPCGKAANFLCERKTNVASFASAAEGANDLSAYAGSTWVALGFGLLCCTVCACVAIGYALRQRKVKNDNELNEETPLKLQI